MNKFYNTRNKNDYLCASKAIIKGLASNMGLYTCNLNEIAKIDITKLTDLNYKQMATYIISHLFDDYKLEDIEDCVNKAYDDKFDTKNIVELNKYLNNYVLELYHGPTCAFKDMALTILPHLLTCAYRMQDNHDLIYILTATSGDTGKAALEGFKDVKNTYISVFYPKDNVSNIQRSQMLTTTGSNTNVIQVNGNFDDCQRIVKECFKRIDVNGVQLSSANSINLGRLIPQVVYYFYAYIKLVNDRVINLNDKVNFVVPCGNFGNILAGYIAKELGCPIAKLVCASNSNDVLFEFINTGIYNRNRPFVKTISPSMDILVSSNVERLLFILSDYNDKLVSQYMHDLDTKGYYKVNDEIFNKIKDTFVAYTIDDKQTKATIKDVYKQTKHCLDTHSAISYHAQTLFKQANINQYPCISLATASAYKFAKDVYNAISDIDENDEFKCMQYLDKLSDEHIPASLANILNMPIMHKDIINKEDGIDYIINKAKEVISYD